MKQFVILLFFSFVSFGITSLNCKASSSKNLKKGRPNSVKQAQVYAAIEDENLILLPSNEVETVYFGKPKVRTTEIPTPSLKDEIKKPLLLVSNKKSEVKSIKKEKTLTQSIPTFKKDAVITENDSNTLPILEFKSNEVIASSHLPKYFQVSSGDINSLTYRMRVVQAILEESGKAYDYRSMKTKELILILNEVRTKKFSDKQVAKKEENPVQQRESMREKERAQTKKTLSVTLNEENALNDAAELPISAELPPLPVQTYEEFQLAE